MDPSKRKVPDDDIIPKIDYFKKKKHYYISKQLTLVYLILSQQS